MSSGHNLRSEKDVEEILKIAVQKDGETTADLRQRMQASAAELGISPEALEEAEQEYAEKKEQEAQQAKAISDQRNDFLRSMLKPAILALALGVVILISSRGGFAAFGPLFIMILVFGMLRHQREMRRNSSH